MILSLQNETKKSLKLLMVHLEKFMTIYKECMGRLIVYLILVRIFKFNVKHFREILTQMVRSSSLKGRGEKGGEKRAIKS